MLGLLQTYEEIHREHPADGRTSGLLMDVKHLAKAMCEPCDWIKDSDSLSGMYPMDALYEAKEAGCLRLVMRDETVRYGSLRPETCRGQP